MPTWKIFLALFTLASFIPRRSFFIIMYLFSSLDHELNARERDKQLVGTIRYPFHTLIQPFFCYTINQLMFNLPSLACESYPIWKV